MDSVINSEPASIAFNTANLSNSTPARILASLACVLVSADIRRIPLAIPDSSIITNSSASDVFDKCVPPQNSIDMSFQAVFVGFAIRSI